MCSRVVAAQSCFHRGVLAADDQQALAEVLVRIAEIMAHVRQIFPWNLQPPGTIGSTGGENEVLRPTAPLPGCGVRGNHKFTLAAIDADHRLIRPHLQVELCDDRGDTPGIAPALPWIDQASGAAGRQWRFAHWS